MVKLKLQLPFEQRYRFARLVPDQDDLAALQAEDPARFAECVADFELREVELAASAARHAAKEREDEEARNRAQRQSRLARGCVNLRDATMDLCLAGELSDTVALREARGWWKDRQQPWLVLGGRTGCGKTVAAADLVADNGGVWMRADDIVRAFSGMFGPPLEQQERAKIAYLLVIEDLGTELDPARMVPALLELLDTRISARSRPTICTTNLTKKEFSERYPNDRLISRMHELVSWRSIVAGDLRRQGVA